MGDGHRRSQVASSRLEAEEFVLEVAIFLARGTVGGLDERGHEVDVAFAGGAFLLI